MTQIDFKEQERRREAAQAQQDDIERRMPAAAAAGLRRFSHPNPAEPPARSKHRHAKELEPLAIERQYVHDQTVARIAIDRALKSGKLDEASLTAEFTRAMGRRNALTWLQRAAAQRPRRPALGLRGRLSARAGAIRLVRVSGVLMVRFAAGDRRPLWSSLEMDEAVEKFAPGRVELLDGHNGTLHSASVVGYLDRAWRTPGAGHPLRGTARGRADDRAAAARAGDPRLC